MSYKQYSPRPCNIEMVLSPAVPGTSRSAKATCNLKAQLCAGETPNPKLLVNFESECRLEDFGCVFSYKCEIWKVFHSRCGNWFKMAEPYSVTVFWMHCGNCNAKHSKGRRFQLLNGLFVKGTMNTPKAQKKVHEPCLGMWPLNKKNVCILCLCPGDDGGGGRSHYVIAQELYKTNWGQLTTKQKAQVERLQQKEWTFCVDWKQETVYSTKCENFVEVWDNAQGPYTCHTCSQTFHDDHWLQSALYIDLPEDKHFKFVNKKFNGKSDAECYAKTWGLLELIQDPVHIVWHYFIYLNSDSKEFNQDQQE